MTTYIVPPIKHAQFSHDGLAAELSTATSCVMHYAVAGFGTHPLKICVTRDEPMPAAGTSKWSCEVSYTSGGKVTTTVEASLEAELNMAAAILDAVDTSKVIMSRADALEAAFQARLLAEYEAHERAQAERQAMIDADVAIGKARATEIAKELKRRAQFTGEASFIAVPRGGDDTLTVNVGATSHRGRYTYYFGSDRTSMQKAIQHLADCSVEKSYWHAM